MQFFPFLANSCCKPKIPEHSTFYSDNSYFYGDKVYTKCDTGYVTGGTALRTCQNNGQYSGAQTTCTSKVFKCNFQKAVKNLSVFVKDSGSIVFSLHSKGLTQFIKRSYDPDSFFAYQKIQCFCSHITVLSH